jgi:hypothetical protein
MAGDTGPLEGRTTRPALMLVVALLAAAAFWKVGPAEIPGHNGTGEPTPEASVAPTATPASEAGGYADGSGVGERTSPAALSPVVLSAAANDQRLLLRVYGDEQALGPDGGWPARAAEVLQERLRVAPAPWTGVAVELEVIAHAGLTAAHALDHLRDTPARPELVLFAVGWADGRAGKPASAAVAPDPDRDWWLDELAGLHAHRDVGESRGFYVHAAVPPRVSARHHLACLDAAGAWGARHDVAVLYLEQPILEPLGDRRWFPSTAMRPQPWISLVYGFEQQPDPASLAAEEVPLLSPTGEALVGRFVGVGLVHAVIGGS